MKLGRTAMGFQEAEAVEALSKQGQNVAMAVDYLLSGC
jgi:hypothetical protein